MTYVTWAVLYEGGTDAIYFDSLIPRVMEDIVLHYGKVNSDIAQFPAARLLRGTIDDAAKEACDRKDGFHLIFFHADTGGRGLAPHQQAHAKSFCDSMHAFCDWPYERCIPLLPRHETEAWVLADPSAVTTALGYRGSPVSVGLPANAAEAERVPDPKAVLELAVEKVRGRRRSKDVDQIMPAIAQRQSLHMLRTATSFIAFERHLMGALRTLGCV